MQAARFGAEVLSASQVTGLEARGSARVLHTPEREVVAHAVVLATEVTYRRLPAEGADELTGRGVYYGSSSIEAASCADEHVVVVGGANSAGQAAVYLSRFAERVTMVVRGPALELSMSHYLIQQIRGIDSIEVRTCTQVTACEGDGHLEQVHVADSTTGATETLDASHVFVFIGARPLTDWMPDDVRRDRAGFVVTGPDLSSGSATPTGWPLDRAPYLLETSLPGVFAAGDVRGGSVKRVASAVGEGALAVTLVHRFMEQQ